MKRRTFLHHTTVAAAGIAAALVPNPLAEAQPASRIVDTHTHFYDPTRKEGVPWPPKGTPLYRTVLPKDWLAVAAPLGVKETVIVEASKWLEDNAWILNVAENEPCIVGFVGHLTPNEIDFAGSLKRFAANPIFRGVRVSNANFADNVDKPEFRAGIKLMTEMGIELDINGGPALHLPVAKLASEFSELRIVIDHVGGAGDASALHKEWIEGMIALGKQKNVYCKISGMQEQTIESEKSPGHSPHDVAYYAPILDHCWNCFGADRLVYGSNWPVSDKGGSYADQFKIVSDYFTAKGSEACEKYFWKNSRDVYRWIERNPKK